MPRMRLGKLERCEIWDLTIQGFVGTHPFI
jgi:hypothetical protein